MISFFLVILTTIVSDATASSFVTAWNVYRDDERFPRTIDLKGEHISLPTRYPKVKVELFETKNWKMHHDKLFDHEKYRSSDGVVKTFVDATVWRASSRTFFRNDVVFSASMRCHLQNPIVPYTAGRYKGTLEEAALISSEIWGEGYFHVVNEQVLSLGILGPLLRSNPDMRLITEGRSLATLRAYLLLLREDPDRRLFVLKDGESCFVQRLHVPYYSTCGCANAVSVRETREWLRSARTRRSNATDVVVVDRAERGHCKRCLRNTPEIVRSLTLAFPDRRVRRVVFGSMSLEEQADVVSRAELLVAPHGAGLTNMIFLPDHGKVLEIQNHPEYFNYAYVEMALALNLTYRSLPSLYDDYSQTDVDILTKTARRTIILA